MEELPPATWLEPARREGRALIAARLEETIPSMPTRRSSLGPVIVLLSIIASSAWAVWRHPNSQPTVSPMERVPVVRPIPAELTVPVKALPVAPLKKAKKVSSKPAAPAVLEVEEPLGEVIEVKRRSSLPPLFDVGEYKSRGVMVK